jgi:hypothetical protein
MGEGRSLRRARAAGVVLVALAAAHAGRAQQAGISLGPQDYDARYGEAVWIGLEALLSGDVPMEFRGKAIHTRGIFRANPAARRAGAYGGGTDAQSFRNMPRFMLTTAPEAEAQGGLSIQPVPELADSFEGEATDMREREVDVVGILGALDRPDATAGRSPGTPSPPPPAQFTFWKFWSEDAGRPMKKGGPIVSMEQVVGKIHRYQGVLVRFRGQFRGRDLFGEAACPGSPSDGWVVKDGPFAVWVDGQKPQGRGWSLHTGRREDTERWLEIVGRPGLKGECIVVRAEEVYPVTGP